MDDKITNTNDIRTVLSDELVLLRTGAVQAQRVNAVCNVVGKILQSVRLDMEFERSQRIKKPKSYDLNSDNAVQLEHK